MDTIIACSTPMGHSGIALIRMSGDLSKQIIYDLISKPLEHRKATYCTLHEQNEIIDSCIVCLFQKPNSYTGEDLIEISCHGNPVIIEHVVQQCIKRGARPARKGEFTKRALLNQKLSLLQAESLDALIHSTSLSGVKIAQKGIHGKIDNFIQNMQLEIVNICAELEARLDYPGDELEYINDSELLKKMQFMIEQVRKNCFEWEHSKRKIYGAKVALVGEVNAGKSSLFNRLVDMERAIVSSIAGTTRDVIEKSVFIHGLEICFFDTAGKRDSSHDEIEIQGMNLGTKLMNEMDAIILVIDPQNIHEDLVQNIISHIECICIVVFTHADMLHQSEITFPDMLQKFPHYFISSITGEGMEALKHGLYQMLFQRETSENQFITSQRQYDILMRLIYYLENSMKALPDLGPAIAIDDLTTCLEQMSEFSGQDVRELILDQLFSRFCIGK